MKKCYLQYNFQGSVRELDFDSLFEFSRALDRAMDDPNVLAGSIKFWTE